MTDDATLLHRFARDNSSAAFAEIVGRYLPLVYSAAVRRLAGDTHRAEDVAQAVFSALARHAARVAEHPNLAGWLYTATRNEVLDELRREKRQRARETHAYIMNRAREDDKTSPEWSQLAPVLDGVLDQLGAADREAVLLRFFHNLPFGEIGGVLGVSEEAARKRVDRALDKLQSVLRGRGIASSSGALAATLTAEAALPVSPGFAASIATVATSGAAAVGAVTFFAMTKLYVGLGAVILLSTAATVVYYFRDSAVATSAVPLTAPTVTDLSSEPIAVTSPLPPPARAVTLPAPAPSPIDTVQARRELARRWLEYAESPEFVRARIEVGRSRMMDVSKELFALLGLTPEQIPQLVVLLTEKRIAPTEVALADLRAGVLPDTSTEEFFQRVIAERAKTNAEIKAYLGEPRFRQLEDYYRSLEEKNVFTRLARALDQTPDALTPAQTEQLRHALREKSDERGFLTPGVIAGARDFLTPVQVDALVGAHRTQVTGRLQRFEEALPPLPPAPPK